MGGWGMMDHFVDNKLLLSHSKAPACGAEEGGATELVVVGHRMERMPGRAGTARSSVLAACTWIVAVDTHEQPWKPATLAIPRSPSPTCTPYSVRVC